MTRVLGFDIGERWLGVAVGDTQLGIATPRPEVRLTDPVTILPTLLQLIQKEQAAVVVIGMPYTLRGEAGPQALAIQKLVDSLRRQTDAAVHTVDERLTSQQGASIQRATRTSRGKGSGKVPAVREDSTAATLLLQTWFDRESSRASDQ
ncbi:MAG: putative pre-16S rRNA nuclease [bacterium]|nr:putative pre-16S rRNA nuclease [bacterium]